MKAKRAGIFAWISWLMRFFRALFSRKPKRAGIYGGKFDPPHVGHLICAEMTREAFQLDKVLFVTSANPPHKKTGVLDADIRHEMVRAAVAPNCYFEACDVELKREGPSFTVDTVRDVHRMYGPGTELFLLMGSEYLDPNHPWHLSKWHDVEDLFRLCTLLVFSSRDQTVEQSKEWAKLLPQARFDFLDFCPAPPVSSTMIRDRVAKGLSVWYMVLPEVWRIIRDRGLYGVTAPRRSSPGRKLWNALSNLGRSFRDRLVSVVRRIRNRLN
jgi:nicotinate-nucleotide adenylyltransferase